MRADLVILDMPPLLPTSDAAVVARLTAGVVLVARAGSTRSNQFVSAVESLFSVEARVLGVIINRLPPRSAAQQYGGGYEFQPDPSGERNQAPELAGGAAVPLGAGPTSRA
jgi:succinoglycan biosynthesis transport protein ExoP